MSHLDKAPSAARRCNRRLRGLASKTASTVIALLLIGTVTPLVWQAAGPSPAAQAAGAWPAAAAAIPKSDPVGLINVWRVTAKGEKPDTWLRLDAYSYQLFRTCGHWEGGWMADSRSFFASAPYSMSGACSTGDRDFDPVPWLAAAVAYEPKGKGWRLLDAAGAELATLTIDGVPPPDPNLADEYRLPPAVTPRVRAFFKEPAPLPAGIKPATVASLTTGTWVFTGGYNPKAYLRFYKDGRWGGSDGCNGRGGAWRLVDNQGRLFTSSGMSTLIGCNNAPTGLYRNGRVGFDGKTLVLVSPNGEVYGRLAQKGSPEIRTYYQLVLGPDMTGNGIGELLGVHGTGQLHRFSMATSTTLAAKPVTIGYADRSKVYAPGDWDGDGIPDLIMLDFLGRMYLRAGNGVGGTTGSDHDEIGHGWMGYSVIPAGDLTGDGNNDLLAIKESTGDLYLYAGNGKGGFKYPYPKVGHGWKGYQLHAAGDVDGDGKADILSIDTNGDMFLYRGKGNGSFVKRVKVGNGWKGYSLAAGADLTGDGLADIVGRDDATGVLYLYKGKGKGTFAKKIKIGHGF